MLNRDVEILIELELYPDVSLLYDVGKEEYKEDIKIMVKKFCENNNAKLEEVLDKLNYMASCRDKTEYPEINFDELYR